VRLRVKGGGAEGVEVLAALSEMHQPPQWIGTIVASGNACAVSIEQPAHWSAYPPTLSIIADMRTHRPSARTRLVQCSKKHGVVVRGALGKPLVHPPDAAGVS
jgi:hypothetical protein